MPRDGSGIYSLPTGNPVVSQTVIDSTWANLTMSDIAAQLNNVFTRDGLLGPSAPFKIVDGNNTNPGIAFNSEPSLGIWRVGPGQMELNGVVTVDAAPTLALGVATKGYVDALFSSAPGGGFLPLGGGTLTGDLVIQKAGTPLVRLNATDAPVDAKFAIFRLLNSGQMLLGRMNEAQSAWTAGIYWEPNGVPLDLKTGGTIWHSANDGTGSGLNADLLRDATLNVSNSAWTVVQRDGSGNIFCGALNASNRVAGGFNNAGWLNGNQGSAIGFGWDGRLQCWIDNGYQHGLARWGADVNTNNGWHGWFQIGNIIVNYGRVDVGNDSSARANFSRGFPNACWGVVATVNYGGNLGGNNMISTHVLGWDAGGCNIGISENGPTGFFGVTYFAVGY